MHWGWKVFLGFVAIAAVFYVLNYFEVIDTMSPQPPDQRVCIYDSDIDEKLCGWWARPSGAEDCITVDGGALTGYFRCGILLDN